jgi:predicted transcriptional regulator of viral defense system
MMLAARTSLSTYITRLQGAGRVAFTRAEAKDALRIKDATFLKGAERLQSKHQLLNPRHGFYVVVPPQYLTWGAPPPAWYIDNLMGHEGRPYYVGLLKAAELHGATHHAVMEFQVITNKQYPKIRAGRSLIAFYFRKDIQSVLSGLESHKTDTGSMKISSIELTALDLLRYLHVVGGIDTVATVLSDIGSRIDGGKLAALAAHFERAPIQRLGYLLDRLGHPNVAEQLRSYLFAKLPVPWIQLEPKSRKQPISQDKPIERNERWHVIVYRHPEVDE